MQSINGRAGRHNLREWSGREEWGRDFPTEIRDHAGGRDASRSGVTWRSERTGGRDNKSASSVGGAPPAHPHPQQRHRGTRTEARAGPCLSCRRWLSRHSVAITSRFMPIESCGSDCLACQLTDSHALIDCVTINSVGRGASAVRRQERGDSLGDDGSQIAIPVDDWRLPLTALRNNQEKRDHET